MQPRLKPVTGSHLGKVLARHESDSKRSRMLTALLGSVVMDMPPSALHPQHLKRFKLDAKYHPFFAVTCHKC
jgi:hypothetical protein